jgi:carbon storage regulator
MLILARRIGESLELGNDVRVTVLAINCNQLRIGIDAPRQVAVHREEIYRRVAAAANDLTAKAATCGTSQDH